MTFDQESHTWRLPTLNYFMIRGQLRMTLDRLPPKPEPIDERLVEQIRQWITAAIAVRDPDNIVARAREALQDRHLSPPPPDT